MATVPFFIFFGLMYIFGFIFGEYMHFDYI